MDAIERLLGAEPQLDSFIDGCLAKILQSADLLQHPHRFPRRIVVVITA